MLQYDRDGRFYSNFPSISTYNLNWLQFVTIFLRKSCFKNAQICVTIVIINRDKIIYKMNVGRGVDGHPRKKVFFPLLFLTIKNYGSPPNLTFKIEELNIERKNERLFKNISKN